MTPLGYPKESGVPDPQAVSEVQFSDVGPRGTVYNVTDSVVADPDTVTQVYHPESSSRGESLGYIVHCTYVYMIMYIVHCTYVYMIMYIV